jgi:NTP pyrophosphatase (non-canonical NTP hydrolase)
MQKTFEELSDLVLEWAKEKGILEKGSPLPQSSKTLEEFNEMLHAIINNNRDELIDSIGDQVVTLIIQCYYWDTDIVSCLQAAYEIISKRTGKMVDGKFVKDS